MKYFSVTALCLLTILSFSVALHADVILDFTLTSTTPNSNTVVTFSLPQDATSIPGMGVFTSTNPPFGFGIPATIQVNGGAPVDVGINFFLVTAIKSGGLDIFIINGADLVDVTGPVLYDPATFALLTGTGIPLPFDDVNGAGSTYPFDFSLTVTSESNGQVPEPSTMVLAATGLVCGAWRLRRYC